MELDASLRPRAANYVPLTPIDFLRRANLVFPEKLAVVDGQRRLTYRELAHMVGLMSGGLKKLGVKRGDVVSVLANNCLEVLAAHFAVPMLGAVLNTINTRLDSNMIGYILNHAQSVLVIANIELLASANAARQVAGRAVPIIVIGGGGTAGTIAFETFMDAESEPLTLEQIKDEWEPIAINYTSGTTGLPKGVVCHHRGAYLNSIGNVIAMGFDERTSYLWTLPMFHCNGWQHPWAVTAVGGTHICLQRIDADQIFRLLEAERVSHFCCAPVVLYMLLNHPSRSLRNPARRIKVGTGGAAPTTALIEGLDALGIDPTHLYGLTESYGPATLCTPLSDSDEDAATKARRLARQGFRHALVADVEVRREGGKPVPADGTTMGEIVLRSNTLMAGYYRDADATEKAFADSVFHTGDLAVVHPDGAIEIRDRSKDIIISGGENISSLEIENVLHQHPSVMLAAVVAVADDKWGEVPCACIEIKPGAERPSVESLDAFCRARLAGFKIPRRYVFRELPKTATGKIQKFSLRADLAPN